LSNLLNICTTSARSCISNTFPHHSIYRSVAAWKCSWFSEIIYQQRSPEAECW